jgi:alkylhydroperoxidase/carboxymuconolactone decarboxylase family protein YurZ
MSDTKVHDLSAAQIKDMTALQSSSRLLSRYRDLHGYIDKTVQSACEIDPQFFEHYLQLAETAMTSGPLTAKFTQFVLIAANASITHMNKEALQANIQRARELGASDAELREVLQISSVVGIHSYMVGASAVLEEVARAAGKPLTDRPVLGSREQKIKDKFIEGRKYWSPLLEDLLVASPSFWDAYANFSSYPWISGVLSPKEKELLYITIDVQTTHLFEPGIRIHMANALRYGATKEEILQIAEIVSCLGIQTYLTGLQIMTAPSVDAHE